MTISRHGILWVFKNNLTLKFIYLTSMVNNKRLNPLGLNCGSVFILENLPLPVSWFLKAYNDQLDHKKLKLR